MQTFVDTSAFFAMMNAADDNHSVARAIWVELRERGSQLVTSNYVIVETITLLARRNGFQAVRDFQSLFVPILHAIWIYERLHERAIAALLTSGIRDLSLVDCTSFEVMRERSLDTAFAFDAHFTHQGFTCLT